jgi:dihydroorotate dehydrogenase electron transfer subunit
MPDVCLLWLEAPQITMAARPGQFVMLQCGQGNLLRRPLSIHNVDKSRNNLAFLFSVVGKGTKWLSKQQPGDSIDILGPLGNGFSLSPETLNILLVGGGIGIAPLPFLARTAMEKGYSVDLLLGAATACQLYPQHLIPPGLNCIFTTDDGTVHTNGFITDLMPEHLEKADQIFTCGPSPMYRTMAKIPELKEKQVQISLEVHMGCGFGVCYGCTIKTKQGLKQVCRDGPVFELNDVLWDEFVDI